MNIKVKISPKVTYIFSAIISFIFLIYFAYKGTIAYLIHKELYGGGIDALVALRFALCAFAIFLIFLFVQFTKIKDLKSQRTILRGVFIGWCSISITILILFSSSIYFIILTSLVSIISLITLFSLIDQIKEERNTLSETEIHLLQKLAKKK